MRRRNDYQIYNPRLVTFSFALLFFAFCNTSCGLVWVSVGSGTGSGLNSGVQAAYSIASDWNTFVRRSNTSQLCDGTETSLTACIHGGETRQVITFETSCAGLSMTDHLNVFNWKCSLINGFAVFTSSLQDGKGLVNLVTTQGATPVWNSNFVTLVKSASYTATTSPSTWWNTSQLATLPDSSAAQVTLGAAYSGKVLTSTATLQSTYGYKITTNNVAIVVLTGQELNYLSAASNCEAGANGCVISFDTGTRFGWFEGRMFDGGSASAGVDLYHSNLNHVRNFRGDSFSSTGLLITNSLYNSVNTVAVRNSGSASINVTGSSSNYLTNLTVDNNITVSNTSLSNVLNNIIASSGLGSITVANGSHGNTFTNVTISDGNATDVIYIQGSMGNIFHSVLLVNNATNGIRLDFSFQNTFSQMAIYGNGNDGILSNNGSVRNVWFGNLQVGNNTAANCSIAAADGLVNNTCVSVNGSNAAYYSGPSGNPFLGSVSDSTQTAINGSSIVVGGGSDWVDFDTFFRSWTVDAAFGVATRMRCITTGSTCWVWDWSLSHLDVNVYNRSNNGGGGAQNSTWSSGSCISELDSSVASNVITSAGACSDGSSTTSAVCTGGGGTWFPPRTYLKNATETTTDGTGSMDGLCEAGNSCQYMPNFGAFQGATPLTSCTYKNAGALVPSVQMTGSSTPGL